MSLGELAVKKAMDLGATEAEAYIQKIKTINAEFADEVQTMKTVDSYGIGLRVMIGKKLALQSSSILTEKEIETIVKNAIKIAKASPEDSNWNSLPKKYGKTTVEGTFDKSIKNLTYEVLNDKIIEVINRATENDRKVKVTRGLVTITSGNTKITNNYCETQERNSTNTLFVIYTKAIEGGESSGGEGKQTRSWDLIDFNGITDKAANKALKYVKSKAIESTKMPVIFDNQLFANVLGIMLSPNINSENIQKGRSTFISKINSQIASEDFNLVDDGTLKDGIFTREFDDEGIPTRKTNIITKGVLENFIFDNYRALKTNVKSTGNAGRQYWTAPAPTSNNLILKSGTTTAEEMIKDTKRGLFIEETIGEWLSRPESGEFNATVTHGFLIENGELTKPVNNIVIAGNFFDILMNKIESIGNDIDNSGKIYSPSIKVSEMTIAGK